MSEFREEPRPETLETKLERAESAKEVADIFMSEIFEKLAEDEFFGHTPEGQEQQSKVLRTGIQKFGRRAFFEALNAKTDAEAFMRPPNDDE